jgi:phosphoribosylglycinamide formyltransferase 2
VASRLVRALPDPKGRSKRGVFGCELFVKLGNPEVGVPPKVYFNEVSPRPHDTGMVTLVTQDLSEMALHVRAMLGLPVPGIKLLSPGAAHVVLASRSAWAPRYTGIEALLSRKGVQLRLFGKPLAFRERRMGLALATAGSLVEARRQALEAAHEMEGGIRYG